MIRQYNVWWLIILNSALAGVGKDLVDVRSHSNNSYLGAFFMLLLHRSLTFGDTDVWGTSKQSDSNFNSKVGQLVLIIIISCRQQRLGELGILAIIYIKLQRADR